MRITTLFLGLATALPVVHPAAARDVTSKGVTVASPWTRATPGGATVGAAFMELRTDKDVADKLVSASSPAAGRVEIHTHIMDGDVMKMRKIDSLPLKAGTMHLLKPMGDHIMLFDLKQPLKAGDKLPLTLTFEKAGPIAVEGTVEAAGAMAPAGTAAKPNAPAEKSGGQHHHH